MERFKPAVQFDDGSIERGLPLLKGFPGHEGHAKSENSPDGQEPGRNCVHANYPVQDLQSAECSEPTSASRQLGFVHSGVISTFLGHYQPFLGRSCRSRSGESARRRACFSAPWRARLPLRWPLRSATWFHVSPWARSSWARASRLRAAMTCGWVARLHAQNYGVHPGATKTTHAMRPLRERTFPKSRSGKDTWRIVL